MGSCSRLSILRPLLMGSYVSRWESEWAGNAARDKESYILIKLTMSLVLERMSRGMTDKGAERFTRYTRERATDAHTGRRL